MPLARPPARLATAALSLLALVLLAGGCATHPTPYQPRNGTDEGYEETRLGERVWRVSFRANRYTPETRVLDYVYYRCAELTKQAGYSHFVIQQDYGRTQERSQREEPSSSFGVGFGTSSRSSFWGLGIGVGSGTSRTYVDYHVAVFVIRMLNEEEAAERDGTYEAAYLLESLQPKIEASLQEGVATTQDDGADERAAPRGDRAGDGG